MYCSKCGQQNIEGVNFCTKCGSPMMPASSKKNKPISEKKATISFVEQVEDTSSTVKIKEAFI